MNFHHEILRYLPAQATAAAFIPIILLAFNKLTMRRTVHRQRDLREKVVALNVFIRSMNEFPDVSEHHAECVQDALRQRGLILMQLASLATQKSRASHPLLVAQRSASTSPFVCTVWSVRVGAALDLLFLSDRNSNWLDSRPFSYRLSATICSRATFDWRFRACSSCATGVVLCRSAEDWRANAGCEHCLNTFLCRDRRR